MSGVDRISPIGPHSAVQKVAAAMMDSVDRPVLLPYSQGSMRLLLISSSAMISPSVISSICQPGSTAKASASGKAAEIMAPT